MIYYFRCCYDFDYLDYIDIGPDCLNPKPAAKLKHLPLFTSKSKSTYMLRFLNLLKR